MVSVFLVGAGPGDPDLLTVKALRLLREADVVLHDSLVGEKILELVSNGARLVDVGKRCGKTSAAQAEICRLLVREAQAGQRVVRLKGGDPMVFGRATEEMDALREAGIAFEVVPGITAATAAASALQISLTRREVARSVHFLTGHGAAGGLPEHDWVALARGGGTLAVYMGAQTLPGLAAHLIEAGMAPEMPALAVESAALPGQRVLRGTLGALPRLLAAAAPSGPVLLLIGQALEDDAVAQGALAAAVAG